MNSPKSNARDPNLGQLHRNVTADQFAGAAADEIEDRALCRNSAAMVFAASRYSFLPRKSRLRSMAPQGSRAIKVHDIGYQIVKNAEGEVGFAVYVGGGLGRTPWSRIRSATSCRKPISRLHRCHSPHL